MTAQAGYRGITKVKFKEFLYLPLKGIKRAEPELVHCFGDHVTLTGEGEGELEAERRVGEFRVWICWSGCRTCHVARNARLCFQHFATSSSSSRSVKSFSDCDLFTPVRLQRRKVTCITTGRTATTNIHQSNKLCQYDYGRDHGIDGVMPAQDAQFLTPDFLQRETMKD